MKITTETDQKRLILNRSQIGLKQVTNRCLIGEISYGIPAWFLFGWRLKFRPDKALQNNNKSRNKQRIKL